MWSSLLIAFVAITAASGQRNSRQQSRGAGTGWDIRLAVPGEPGSDYPTLDAIPKTSFSCAGKTPGYYADYETNCQVFRVCTSGSTYGFQSFLCPNGTLFNQAVFVCDWWMNVNCDSSQQPTPTASPQFENLRLGPQLMNDVKKMLTHPMRNPYDRTAMRSNLIVMQEYRPPSGQMFANAFAPNKLSNVYIPPMQLQQPYGPSGNSLSDSFVAGSTPSPLYSTSVFNNGQNTQRDVEVFQRQRQRGQYVQQNNQAQNGQYVQANNLRNHQQQNGQFLNALRQNGKATFSNNQASGKLIQQHSGYNNEQQRPNHNYNNQGNAQYSQQTSLENAHNQINQQQGQVRQNAQYDTQTNPGKLTEFGVSYTKQQHNSNQLTQLPQFSNQVTGSVGNEAKQNLVSNTLPATVIAKTLTFNRIVQEPKPGGPKSRITFKTWIVKPSKAARLTAEPTPYTYNRPTTPSQTAKLVALPTPYYYNKPTNTQAAKLVSQPEPYYYNPPTPTQTAKLVSEPGYTYNKPTTPEKQVEVTGYSYNKPTTPEKQIISTVPTLPARLYLTPSLAPPSTVPSKLYLAATTFKPLARLYIPPSSKPPELSRQYLNPSAQSNYYQQNAKLQASPTTPTPVIVPAPDDKSTYSVTKHSRINTNNNNLTFTDILTKEKLDITVNDIVKDTRNILGTASTQQGQGEEEEYPDEENYITSTAYTESGENLSPATPTVGVSKSARLVAKPASDLEPPVESYETGDQNTNRLAALPFYKESIGPTNTIERTVSLKISIPERTAAYLFNTSSDSHHDKLEILNTGSSNYLVLTNKLQNTSPSFIPIGKLIVDKNSSISNSQALVFSFLADSINQVKEYKNLAQENHPTVTSQSQFQTINSEDLASITDKVTQLTSAQYTAHNNNHLNQLVSTQHTNTGNLGSTYANNFQQNKDPHSAGAQSKQNTQSGQYYSSHFQGGDNALNANLHTNNEQQQLYSGQLYQAPVPDVARIYNGQSSAKLINNNIRKHNTEVDDLHQNTNNNNNNLLKQSSADVELVQSHSVPHPAPAPAKLQAPRQPQSFTSQEDTQSFLGNFVNTGNGISAQLRDKIVGTITHPSQENKLVTYKKDQSYYVFTKLDDIREGLAQNSESSRYTQNNAHNAKLTQGSNADNTVTFQFIPSVSYQLEDAKEQQKLLNSFNIDEFGSPKENAGSEYQNGNSVLTSNVDYTVQHTPSSKQQYNRNPSELYVGPSSYSAPQSSVGRLEAQQNAGQYQSNNPSAAKLELEDSSKNGYPIISPTPTFTF